MCTSVKEKTPSASEPIPADVWRIHGRDYDMTSFVDEHPGGALMILLGKGTDCTLLFEVVLLSALLK